MGRAKRQPSAKETRTAHAWMSKRAEGGVKRLHNHTQRRAEHGSAIASEVRGAAGPSNRSDKRARRLDGAVKGTGLAVTAEKRGRNQATQSWAARGRARRGGGAGPASRRGPLAAASGRHRRFTLRPCPSLALGRGPRRAPARARTWPMLARSRFQAFPRGSIWRGGPNKMGSLMASAVAVCWESDSLPSRGRPRPRRARGRACAAAPHLAGRLDDDGYWQVAVVGVDQAWGAG
jgi:hypothetical protein